MVLVTQTGWAVVGTWQPARNLMSWLGMSRMALSPVNFVTQLRQLWMLSRVLVIRVQIQLCTPRHRAMSRMTDAHWLKQVC